MERHGRDVRYVAEEKKWFIWDGKRWEIDRKLQIVTLAKEAACSGLQAGANDFDPESLGAHLKWTKTSLSRPKLNAAIELARPEAAILREDFDRNPWLLCVQNGTIDLLKGELRDHRRTDMISRYVPVSYDPGARCSGWMGFLDRILGGDEELVRYLQLAMGYTLSGSTREQCFFILHGSGCNGKSVLMETFRKVLGEYAVQADFSSFAKQISDGRPRNDLARMRGTRLVAASEINRDKALDEATVKQLTGCDMVTARFLNQEFFDYTATAKIWMAANNMPRIMGQDDGIWRRVRIIPFLFRIPEEERDLQLPKRLEKELPGILAWLVDGCRSWQEVGLREPRAVLEAVAAYRDDQDVLAEFIGSCCIEQLGARERTTILYQAYSRLCHQNGEEPISIKEFGSLLSDRGFRAKKSGGLKYRLGVRLKRAGEGGDGRDRSSTEEKREGKNDQ